MLAGTKSLHYFHSLSVLFMFLSAERTFFITDIWIYYQTFSIGT